MTPPMPPLRCVGVGETHRAPARVCVCGGGGRSMVVGVVDLTRVVFDLGAVPGTAPAVIVEVFSLGGSRPRRIGALGAQRCAGCL